MRRLLVPLLALGLLPGCVKDGGDAEALEVVTAVYPMRYVAERVGGPDIRVIDVAPPGEPHDAELSPTQTGQVAQADLVLLVGGLQPAVDDAAPDDRTLDALTVADGTDPHVWLDPLALADVAEAFAQRLGELDDENSAAYVGRASQLRDDLTALHEETAARLKTCELKDFVTTHAAFGRFAARYGLRETAVSTGDADAEPSPRRIAEVLAFMRKNGVKAVYGHTPDSAVAETMAREVRGATGVLDPIEVRARDGADYLAVMRKNLGVLALGLRC